MEFSFLEKSATVKEFGIRKVCFFTEFGFLEAGTTTVESSFFEEDIFIEFY